MGDVCTGSWTEGETYNYTWGGYDLKGNSISGSGSFVFSCGLVVNVTDVTP